MAKLMLKQISQSLSYDNPINTGATCISNVSQAKRRGFRLNCILELLLLVCVVAQCHTLVQL